MVAPAPVDGKPLSDPDFDPVWAAFSDEGVAPVFHVSEFESPLHPAWRTGEQEDGEQLFDSIFLYMAPAVALANLILNGVLERFPRLRIGVVELTASWVPHFLLHIDGASDFYAAPSRGALPLAGRASVHLLPAPGPGGRAALRDAEPSRAQGRGRHLHDRQRLAPRRRGGGPDGARRSVPSWAWRSRPGATSWGPTPPGSSACDRRPRSGGGRARAPAGRVPQGASRPATLERARRAPPGARCAPTSSGRSASTKSSSASRWSSSSRTATTRARRTCSSTWATTTPSPSSTSPTSGSARTEEVLGGFHHLAISVDQEHWDAARARLEAAGIPTQIESEISLVLLRPRRRAPRVDRRGPRLALRHAAALMAVTGMANLAVKVADLEGACEWYRAAGATVTEPVAWENGRRADVQLGTLALTLFTQAIYEDACALPRRGVLAPRPLRRRPRRRTGPPHGPVGSADGDGLLRHAPHCVRRGTGRDPSRVHGAAGGPAGLTPDVPRSAVRGRSG